MQTAVFAGGCFWCSEAIFKRLRGVKEVVSGYAGGKMSHPSYQDVSSGATGHAEAVQVEFDPKQINYEDLLYVFFRTHDPTQLNRQGADVGEQYRSLILYASDQQKAAAQKALSEAQKEYPNKIVTEVVPLKEFFPAESHHQDYYAKHKSASYCRVVIDPKIKKLQTEFAQYLKK